MHMIERPAWQDVVDAAGGSAWRAGLNITDTGGGIRVLLLQVDERVYTVGEIDYEIGRAHV